MLIHPYDGYLGENFLVVSGRVLHNRHVEFSQKDSKFRNFINSWKNFITKEIGQMKVFLKFLDVEAEAITNKEGYFMFKVPIEKQVEDLDHPAWLTYSVSLNPDQVKRYQKQTEVEGEGRVYIYNSKCRYGLISDIDDTLLVTDVSTLFRWRMFYYSVFLNPLQRKIFSDGPKTIEHLTTLDSNEVPVFYISNSPNNLYYYVRTILDHHAFKQGPVFLRDIGRQLLRPKNFTKGNKYKQAYDLFNAYPHKKFMLLGDAAEADIKIYSELARVFPNRVQLIAIRSLGNKKKDLAILEEKEKSVKTPIFLFKDLDDLKEMIMAVDFS